VTRADALIIGGGAIGAAIAYELGRRRMPALLIERGSALATGCSSGSAGLIRSSHAEALATRANLKAGLRWALRPDSPFALRLAPSALPWLLRFARSTGGAREAAARAVVEQLSRASVALHRAYAETVDVGLRESGVLEVYRHERTFQAARERVESAGRPDLGFEVVGPERVAEYLPALSGAVAGGILCGSELMCEPERFVTATARASGARIRCGVEALELLRDGRSIRRVRTTAGDIEAGQVILAAGVWSGRLARTAGLRLPLEGGKGYHLDLRRAEDDPRLPVMLTELRIACTPFPEFLRLSGTLELSGLDPTINRRRLDSILRGAQTVLGDLGGRAVVDTWSGLRPVSADGLPVIGRPAGLDNLVIATGHGQQGLHLAPATGRIVADLVALGRTDFDLRLLSPDRFN
jgi:D-amino-acid dehydrogenase